MSPTFPRLLTQAGLARDRAHDGQGDPARSSSRTISRALGGLSPSGIGRRTAAQTGTLRAPEQGLVRQRAADLEHLAQIERA